MLRFYLRVDASGGRTLGLVRQVTVYLTEEQVKALDAEARRLGTTRSAVIREIIDRDMRRRAAVDR